MPQLRLLVTVVLLGAACKQVIPEPPKQDAGPDTGLPGAGVGGACLQMVDCRVGLVCKDSKTCQPPGDKVPGSSCILSEECLRGYYCAMGICQSSGMVAEGGTCSKEGDCASGLVCNRIGLSGTCAKPGPGDLGAACTMTSGCRAGLVCANGTCNTMVTMPPPATGQCFDEEPLPVAKVHFRVPRAADTSDDFYRLPFPNDIRMKNGKVTLTRHPVPGPSFVLGVDVVDRYLRAIEAEATGFSLNPAVYFRFSRNPSFDSLKVAGAVSYTNITPSSPQYGQVLQPGWFSSTGKERYICPRWIAVRHGFGAPLRPGETYAFLLKTTVTDDKGAAMQQDDDFKAMLSATMPGATMPPEPELAAAWTAYAPLRAWIADKKVDPATLAAAAVFTTEKVDEPLAKMRAAVRAAAAPVVKGLVKCGEGKSPCDDGKTGAEHVRGCFVTSPAFDEYQGTITLPVFQKGTPPYDQPSDGGGVEFEGGLAKIQRTEDVCFSLTVPKAAAPAAGWPLVVYGHGTGGSYRSFVELGLAGEFAAGDVGGGPPVPMAMLGYDGALHGSRKGSSTRPVTELFYNFLNPLAARDNSMQAAADLFALARAAEAFSGIKLDPAKLGLYGHSQGGNAAANAMPFEPAYGAVALSGTGGTLILSLLRKTKPVDIPAVLPFALGDAKVNENHPVLNLLQMYLDRADAVNFGRRLFSEPVPPNVPRHALHIFGTADTFSPEETQRTYAQAAGFSIVGPVVDPVDMKDIAEMRKLPPIAAPAKGNITTAAGAAITAVQAQYKPAGASDGHFVSTDNASARRAVRQMLGTFVRDGVPTVTP